MQLLPSTRKSLIALITMLLLPTSAFAEKILRYSDHEPLGGMRTQFINDVFFRAIEKESDGRLKIEKHWDSTVSTGYDALRVVRDGSVADMAIVVPEYSATELPLHQLFKSFPTGPSGSNQVDFFRRAYTEIPAFPAELEKNNVVQILLGTGYPVAFFSTGALDSLEDLKGHTWRTASFWHRDFLHNAGSIPVSIPWGEGVFNALRDQTLHGLKVNVDSGYMLKVHEVAPNVLLSRDLWLGHLYVLAMNRNTWNNLAQEDKAAIQRAAETAYRQLGEVMDNSFDAIINDLQQHGAQVRLLSTEELAAWNVATGYRDVQAAWAHDQQSKGVKEVMPVLEKLTEILSKAESQDLP